jgi:hypothetical protein
VNGAPLATTIFDAILLSPAIHTTLSQDWTATTFVIDDANLNANDLSKLLCMESIFRFQSEIRSCASAVILVISLWNSSFFPKLQAWVILVD